MEVANVRPAGKNAVVTASKSFRRKKKKKSVHVVVSRFKDDVSWIGRHCLDNVPGHHPARFLVYTKRGGTVLNRTLAKRMCGGRVVLRTIPNVGLEAGTILQHIVGYYKGLADVTVFMGGDAPAEGWAGHRRGGTGSHFWRNVRLRDYVAHGPLWVPTCMRSSDHVLIHFRKGYMKDKAKFNYSQFNTSLYPGEFHYGKYGEGARRFSRCSPRGMRGWRPWIRDRWVWKFFAPLVRRQSGGRNVTLCEYWGRHLGKGPACPPAVVFANGALFSVSRAQITARPVGFYTRLLDDGVNARRDPYQAYYLETMWAYIFFHRRTYARAGRDEFCPRDVAPFPQWAAKFQPAPSIEYLDDDNDRVRWLLKTEPAKQKNQKPQKFLQKFIKRKGGGPKAAFRFQSSVAELQYDPRSGTLFDNHGMGGALPAKRRQQLVSRLQAFASAAHVTWRVVKKGTTSDDGGRKLELLDAHGGSSSHRVDVVYLWVNGTDPTRVRDFKRHRPKNALEDAASPNRFRNWNELFYSLQLLHRNAVNLGRVFVVTAGETPHYKEAFPGVAWVTHAELSSNQPALALPTFSSNAIQWSLVELLPRLSDPFVLMDDDFFIRQRLNLTEFARRRPRTWYENPRGATWNQKPKSKHQFVRSMEHSNHVLRRHFPSHRPQNTIGHVPYVVRHSTLRTAWAKLGDEIKATQRDRFRSATRLTFAYTLSNVERQTYGPNDVQRLPAGRVADFIMMKDNVTKLVRTFDRLLAKPKQFLAINDNIRRPTAEHWQAVQRFFREMLAETARGGWWRSKEWYDEQAARRRGVRK